MIGWYLLLTIVSAAFGFMLGIFPGVLLLGPLLHARGVANGAPFHEGDAVQIISGSHRGTITRVYSGWQGESVRVDLGVAAQRTYDDVFSPTQLLRVANAETNARPNGGPTPSVDYSNASGGPPSVS